MAIVVGDIHGNVEKVQAFLAYRPDQPHIALGDYCDSFYEPLERQLECLQLLLASDALLLWGNHELHYLKKPPFICSGYSNEHASALRELIESNKRRFMAACVADDWLCTHGGVCDWLAKGETDPHRLAERFNLEMEDFLARPGDRRQGIFAIGSERGGTYSKGGGIFWFDTRRESANLARNLRQITGHTEQEPLCRPHLVTLDTTNNDFCCWLYDTTTAELVNAEMPHRRIRNLPPQEQEAFRYYLRGRSAPHLKNEPNDEQDAYWPTDFKEWVLHGKPGMNVAGKE